MDSAVLAHEPAVRLAAFAAVLAGMLAWEYLAPRRSRTLWRRRRWPANLGIVVLDTASDLVSFTAHPATAERSMSFPSSHPRVLAAHSSLARVNSESPYVLAGQGPWAPSFEAALREALEVAAGTGD